MCLPTRMHPDNFRTARLMYSAGNITSTGRYTSGDVAHTYRTITLQVGTTKADTSVITVTYNTLPIIPMAYVDRYVIVADKISAYTRERTEIPYSAFIGCEYYMNGGKPGDPISPYHSIYGITRYAEPTYDGLLNSDGTPHRTGGMAYSMDGTPHPECSQHLAYMCPLAVINDGTGWYVVPTTYMKKNCNPDVSLNWWDPTRAAPVDTTKIKSVYGHKGNYAHEPTGLESGA